VKKILRRLLLGLLLALVLAGLAVALLFSSPVQTMLAQSALARQPALRASLGSLSASFGQAEITNLRFESGCAVLSLPTVEASLPVTNAFLHRKFQVRSLVAKGWTLDLSRCASLDRHDSKAGVNASGAEGQISPMGTVIAQWTAQLFGAILGHWALPDDTAFDKVELDGHVLLPGGPDLPPVQVHVVMEGANLVAGHESVFTVVADADLVESDLPLNAAALHGRVVVTFDSAGVLDRFGLQAEVGADGRGAKKLPPVTVDFAAAHAADGGTCSLALRCDSRTLVNLRARFLATANRFEGDWDADLQSGDLAPFLRRPLSAAGAAVGTGKFAAAADLSVVQVAGDLKVTTERIGDWKRSLEPIGAVTLTTGFDLTRAGAAVQFERLQMTLAGAHPVATVRTLQPFRVDAASGELQPADPRADWLEGTLQRLPLGWLAGWAPGWTLDGGDLTGGFVVRAASGGFTVRSTEPLSARGVSFLRMGRPLARNLDVSLEGQAERGSGGWQVHCAPFTIGRAGRRFVAANGTAALPANVYEPVVLGGKWESDLDVLAPEAGTTGPRLAAGRTTTGEFSITLGDLTTFSGSLSSVGHDPEIALTASVQGQVGAGGAGTFFGPVRLALGPKNVSEIGVECTLTGEVGSPLYLDLTGAQATWDHLCLLAAPLPAFRRLLLDGGGGAEATPHMEVPGPFWGDWTGRAKFAFDQLTVAGRDFAKASGYLEIGNDKVRLQNGRGDWAPHNRAQLEGTITFDGTAAAPYRLNATGSTEKLDAAPLFPPVAPGEDPVITGHFDLAATFTGAGNSWSDLLAHTQEEYRLTSTTGIIRFLKTSIAGINPEKSSRVSETMINSATSVSHLLGVKGDKLNSGQRTLAKNAEAVLQFSYRVAELGYSQAAVTAIRGADRTLRLADISLTTRDLQLTGDGRIGAVPDRPLAEQALDVELRVGIRDSLTVLVADAGLLSAQKDAAGYTLFGQSVHFGGTPGHIDCTQWHDLLFNAAKKPAGDKKSD
jgi:hypothetical protein